MKTAKYLIGFVLFIGLIIPFPCHADDTSIYDIAQDVKPNVLIIFDNSGSMDAIVDYNNGVTYDLIDPATNKYASSTIYQYTCTNWWWDKKKKRWVCDSWGWVAYTGTFTDTNLDGIHDSDSNIKKGNRLNYDFGNAKDRIHLAREAVKDVIDLTKDYVRFGIMVLNAYRDINGGATYTQYHNDTTILSSTYGGAEIKDRTDAEIEVLMDELSNLDADGGTPLADRLINAALYFRGTGGFKDKNGVLLSRPLDTTNWCRKNFVIIMTDGKPEGEGNSYYADEFGEYPYIESFLPEYPHPRHWDYDNDGKDPNEGGEYIHGGSDYLDDVAKYLHDTDDSLDPTHTITGDQNLTIYTIGFTIDHQLLADTATNGGGKYYTADDADELAQALLGTLIAIIEQTQTFTAPVVPVQRTTSGTDMYVSLFTPKSDSNFWPGYLIKLHIGDNGELLGYSTGYGTGSEVPVTDSNGVLSENLVKPTEPPYPVWDAQDKLRTRTASRNIYTYLGTSTDLTDSSNAFNTTTINDTLLASPAKHPNAQTGTDAYIDLINFIIGLDSYDADKDNVYNEKRDTILGDILHSRPLIVDYSSTQRVIYVGTNDGQLHAFSDTDGSEKWAFIPPDLLPTLKYLAQGTTHPYFVDSSPKVYTLDGNNDGDLLDVSDDKVIIIFGERGGGTSYTALDVTNPNVPVFLWRINNTGDYAAMGQTWAEPQIGKVKVGAIDKDVAIIGGGYTPDNSKGNALYIVDVHDGSLIKSFTSSDDAHLTYSIPSTVLAADTTFDNYINRVYVGDAGGQLWQFALHRENGSDTRVEDGDVNDWTPRRLFQAASGTKIFYQPDLVLEPGYAYVYFGTGDRDNPMLLRSGGAPIDRLYAVKDRNENNEAFSARVVPNGVLVEGDLTDLTSNVLQDPTDPAYASTLAALNAAEGWILQMAGDGEKVLASPIVFYGMVLFTTFIPNTDPCSYGGSASIYAVDYLTATAVMDLDADGNIDRYDRSTDIGHGIPTEVVITIDATGKSNAYIGAGGGIILVDLTTPGGNFTIESWRENF